MGSFCCRDAALGNLDLSGTRVQRLGESVCSGCSKLREVLLPRVLGQMGAFCFQYAALKRLDLSEMRLEVLHFSTCAWCLKFRVVLLPSVLKRIRSWCFVEAALESLDLSGRMWRVWVNVPSLGARSCESCCCRQC
jgi:hypothetical protein